MGKRGGWFAAVKKAITRDSKDKKSRRSGRCFGKQRSIELDSSTAAPSPMEDTKLIEAENEQNRHAYSVALVTAMAAEAAVAAAHAAAEIVRLRTAACKITKEEIAATKIQTAFRGYLARRALRALRGLARLRSLIQGHSVKRQAAITSKCLQTMGRVQSEVRAWRIRALDANNAVQRQNQHKHGEELRKLQASVRNEGKWNDSTQSKERMESNLYNRQKAARRRERALAYAYSHQQPWRNSANRAYMDPSNPCWVWNWLERWMAARSWENGSSTAGKEPNSDLISPKINSIVHSPTATQWRHSSGGRSPLTPKSMSVVRLQQLITPRGGNISINSDNESKSMNSAQSVPCPKHGFAGSSVRDDDSVTISSPAASGHSYMASTESARAKLRSPSPLRHEKLGAHDGKASSKRRLSFS